MSENSGVIIFLIVLFSIWLIVLSVQLFNVIERIKKLEIGKKKSKPKSTTRYYGGKRW